MISITLGIGPSGPLVIPLWRAPHILIAGMTGSGKSVLAHSLITQLMTYGPREVQLVLIDPKRVEYSRYKGIKHLILPPAYELDDADYALRWAAGEMRARFHLMESVGARDISLYPQPWARLVIFIDELANLILARKKLEEVIVTIASMGRAAGVHLALSTQRPSADVVTGLIRANVPTRVCLPVVTAMESRIILDSVGAEELTAPGSMLVRLPGQRGLVRLQGRAVSDWQIDSIVAANRVQEVRPLEAAQYLINGGLVPLADLAPPTLAATCVARAVQARGRCPQRPKCPCSRQP